MWRYRVKQERSTHRRWLLLAASVRAIRQVGANFIGNGLSGVDNTEIFILKALLKLTGTENATSHFEARMQEKESSQRDVG